MEPRPEFDVGQRVSVRVNELNLTPRVGTVLRVVWHFKDACYNYYLEVDGRKIGKRYFASDLISED